MRRIGRPPLGGPGALEGTLLAGRYRAGPRIAAGGMGAVHEGWDERLARPVALKLLHAHLAADPEVERRFRAEARLAARVKHPNVVVVLDADDHDGTPFIVMELVRGTALRRTLSDRGRLTPAEVVDLLRPACAGLSAIHRAGLVHRDVKPENLLVDAGGRVRVADFGIASALDATRHTPAGMLLGSVRYMAPEVVLGGGATAASDQYALGVVIFEALTGRAPLPADDPAAVALRHAREVVPAPGDDTGVSDVLDAVVATATALDPADRYPTLDALVAAADTALATAAAAAVRDTPATAFHPPMHGLLAPPGARPTATGDAPAPWAPQRVGRAHGPVSDPPPQVAAPRPATPAASRPATPAASRPATPAASRPATPAAPRPAAPARPARAARRPLRRGVSVLAPIALVCSVMSGVGGLVVAPLCASVALRRILRHHLRGALLAHLALGIAAVRILHVLATVGS